MAQCVSQYSMNRCADIKVLAGSRHAGADAPAGGFYLRAQRDSVGKLRAWGSMARPAHSGEFSENSPYLQGGFEKQKSKKTKC